MPRKSRPTIVRRLIALALATALCALVVPVADAATGFVPAIPLGGPTAVTQGDVATDANGDTIAVWTEGSPGGVFASIRPAGGTFGVPQRLDDGTGGTQPRVASDAAGNAVAVWNQNTGNTNLVEIVRRAANQPGFDLATRQSEPAGSNPGNPHVVMSPAGDAIVGWQKSNPLTGNTEAWAAITLPGQGAFGAGAILSVSGESVNAFDLAIGGSGDAVALWTTASSGSPASAVRYAVRNPGSAFGGPASIIVGGFSPNSPAVAVDPTGRAVALWREASTATEVHASVRPAGGGFAAPPAKVSDVSISATSGPAVAMDDAGNAWAVWGQNGGVEASRLPAGSSTASSFSPPQTVEAATGTAPNVTMAAGGTAVASWQVAGAIGAVATNFVHAASAPPGGTAFGAPETLSTGNTGAPRGRLDPAGDGAVVFPDSGSGTQQLVVRGFDSTPPQLQGLNVPAAASAGLASAMSFTPFDVWGVGFTGWNFGDGATATGPSTSHAYAAAGDYTVTATATDLVGNTTTATRPVHVTRLPLIPQEGKTVVAQVLSGKVYVATPVNAKAKTSLIKPPHGYTKLRPLTGSALVPVRSLLEASRGKLRIIAARNSTSSQLQSGDFSLGAFTVIQGRTSPLTTATMMGGGNFSTGCRGVKGASVSAARRRPHRSLFSNVHGRFRTRGRNSTATVRGTAFLMKDTCTSTVTKVSRGTVIVRDLRKRKSVKVKAHHSYVALVHPRGR